MSRMKLHALFSAMLAFTMADPEKTVREKKEAAKDLNKQSGGMLFLSSPYGPKPLNQRQKRKRWRQSPYLRRKSA